LIAERDSSIVSILVAEGSEGDFFVIVLIRKLGDNLQADDVLVCWISPCYPSHQTLEYRSWRPRPHTPSPE
jgi:hypothetical protein